MAFRTAQSAVVAGLLLGAGAAWAQVPAPAEHQILLLQRELQIVREYRNDCEQLAARLAVQGSQAPRPLPPATPPAPHDTPPSQEKPDAPVPPPHIP